MLIDLLKFLHVLIALSLLGSVIFSLLSLHTQSSVKIGSAFFQRYTLDKLILLFTPLALITGTLLVKPKHFTFHTPWIDAAYVLLVSFGVGIVSAYLLKKQWIAEKDPNQSISRRQKNLWYLFYLGLIIILILIIHDAVTKTTLLF